MIFLRRQSAYEIVNRAIASGSKNLNMMTNGDVAAAVIKFKVKISIRTDGLYIFVFVFSAKGVEPTFADN